VVKDPHGLLTTFWYTQQSPISGTHHGVKSHST